MSESENKINTEQDTKSGKKQKDCKKAAKIKTVIFLILAAIVLLGMYLKEKPGNNTDIQPAGSEIIRSVPER